MNKIKVGLVGVTGYTGMELARLLCYHPNFELVAVTSRKEAGKKLSAVYPFLQGFGLGDLQITDANSAELAKQCALVFLAIPHGAAMELGAELLHNGCKVVDLSADYRLRSVDTYESWYKVTHTRKNELEQAVYGLPELYAERIKQAKLLANPGCYPTASILGLYPALKHGLISLEDIVIDAKSGTSGAGRGANVSTLYCEVADTFRAYNLGKHRHTPEIEQELAAVAGQDITVSFNPHLLPLNRGILATIYTKLLDKNTTFEDVHKCYEKVYGRSPFVRVLPCGALPELRNVRGTMLCDIGLACDERTGRLIIVSVIDNLCRGASGQAIANANLMCGFALEAGLQLPPLVP